MDTLLIMALCDNSYVGVNLHCMPNTSFHVCLIEFCNETRAFFSSCCVVVRKLHDCAECITCHLTASVVVVVAGYKSSSLNKVSLKKYQKLDATPKMFKRVCFNCFYAFLHIN